MTTMELHVIILTNEGSSNFSGTVEEVTQELKKRVDEENQWVYVGPNLLSYSDITEEYLGSVEEDIIVTNSLTGGSI